LQSCWFLFFSKKNLVVTKTSLLKKICSLILAISLYIVVVHAQIVYTDVNPDYKCSTSGCTYDLDLNNDGITDYVFSTNTEVVESSYCSGTRTNYFVRVSPLNSNEVLSTAYYEALALSSNVILDSNLKTWNAITSQTILTQHYSCNPFTGAGWKKSLLGYWVGVKDKYMGLKIHVGSKAYYGWVQMSVSGSSFTITDYAYNSGPDSPIFTGQETTDYILTSLVSSPYCKGGNINVTYTTHGTFSPSNIFTAQLSDSNGSFAKAVFVGSLHSIGAGMINAIIPLNLLNGTKYRIRVVSSSPSFHSYDNETDLVIGANIGAYSTAFCTGGCSSLFTISEGYLYQWLKNGILIPDATTSSFCATAQGNYQCIVANVCGTDTSNLIFVKNPPKPQVEIATGQTTFCKGDSLLLKINIKNYDSVQGYKYQWEKNNANISKATSNYYYARAGGTYTCKVTGECGSTITAGVALIIKQCLSNSVMNNEKIISNTTQLKIAPNPFSNTTTISFTLSQSTKASIAIFDVNGRLIKVLAGAQMQQGSHQLVWNATDAKGNRVIAGIYFLKMQTRNYAEMRKLVIVR
jgi:hypothetical protein